MLLVRNETMRKILLIAVLLAVSPASFADEHSLLDLRAAIEGLWIQPSQFQQTGKLRFIRFMVLPAEYSASAMLEISLKLPEGHSPDAVAYRLVRNGKEWTAENYAYRNGENYALYLPDLQKDERVEFSLGWEGAALAQYDVVAALTTDQRQKTTHWRGWLLR
jgi:hypothetical protein